MINWYLLFTKAKEEHRVRRNLEVLGLDTYLPVMPVTKSKSREENAFEPMFPRYVFVSMDENAVNFSAIRYVRGIVDFVHFGESVATVPHEVMTSIRTAEKECLMQARPVVKAGDKVLIKKGPFRDIDAVVVAKKSADRVIILIEVLRNSTVIEVRRKDLRVGT